MNSTIQVFLCIIEVALTLNSENIHISKESHALHLFQIVHV